MADETIIVFKFTKKDGFPTHGSKRLPLPRGGRPGAWHDTGGPPILCQRGVHGCRTERDLLTGGWLNEWLWVAELRGPFVENPGNKIAGRSGRLLYRLTTWNEQTARLFAADCAESVAHLNKEPSVTAVIRTARRFAFGLATNAELAAAGAAAWDASGAAAWDAARDAAWAAAWAAAGAAAWDAARDAAGDAQALRLHAYLSGSVDLDAIRKSVE